jgi:hypothetical protein
MPDTTRRSILKRAISPVSGAGDNTAQVSQTIDRAGFDSLEFDIATGVIADADATFTVLVEHGDAANLSDAAAVPDEQLISQGATTPEADAGFIFSSDDQVRKIGYRGVKRYVRLSITPANNTGAWLICAIARLGHPYSGMPTQPTA